MKHLNQWQGLGNLGDEPEMRYTPTGKPVTTFSMATSRKWKDDAGELKEETTWHRIVTWNGLAETCNTSLCKGSLVLVQGRIHNRSWEDDTGVKHYASEIIADQVVFLGKSKAAQDEGTGEPAEASSPTP